MSAPYGQGGGGRTSKPPAPVAPTNAPAADRSTASPIQQAPTGPRATRQNMPSFVGGNPPPSAPPRKRRPDSVVDNFGQSYVYAERAAKRPANASTRSDLASGDAAERGMHMGYKKEGTSSSAAERHDSTSPGAMEAGAAGTSLDPASVKREQTSADGMRPHRESLGSSSRGLYQQNIGIFGPGASGMECRACGSQRHMTKECHVPSVDGTVVICPFHDCSVLDRTGPPAHPLDGLTRHNPGDRLRAPLYCDKVMRYEMAVWSRHGEKIRKLLPEMFRELVLNRKRKPCCRVVNVEVCPINIAIAYSWEFCHGKMPVELAGIWPYTRRDATDPAILAKLEQYDELGWEGMPPGELEAKSWEQIKREYADGIIPPQVHSKNKPFHPTRTATPAAAELGGTQDHLHAGGADVEPQAVDEDGNGEGFPMEGGAVQSQDTAKIDILHQMVGDLSEKVDALSALPEQVRALSEKIDALSALPDEVRSISGKVDALSSLPEQVDALWEKKKDVLHKILDSL